VEPAIAARYWRAIASANMSGRVAIEFQLDAASRAQSLYLAQGQSRRAFSSLVQLARFRISRHDDEGAQAAADEARKLLQPEWPATLRIRLLRMDGYLARRACRYGEALALFREAVRASASTRDWLLEVIARSNLSDLLWLIGPIEEAAREALQLAQELRARPTAHSDMAWFFSNLMGILSEMGRIEEASAVAREALPLMQRDKTYHLEAWAYLFWRRRQFDTATMLVGASEVERRRDFVPLQENELRLMTEARAALEARIHPDELTRGLVAGASLRERALLELISESLAQPFANGR
jgi:tetratricopeptide (TPR) repeat protein